MKTRKLSLSILLLSSALLATASAGYRYPLEVQIDFVNRTAKGALGSARASADNNQAIGCHIGASVGGVPGVSCFATNAAGQTVSCISSNQGLVTAASAVNDSSIILFGWNASGGCTTLTVQNYSSNPPLEP